VEAMSQPKVPPPAQERIPIAQLYRSLKRLHLAVKSCARIGFQESAPTTNEHHASIWNDLNEAQQDAELKLKHFESVAQAPAPPSTAEPPTHILGMEPENVARRMVRNYFALRRAQPNVMPQASTEDCVTLMVEFNKYLVELNEILQRQVLDKLGTTLPAPILAAPLPAQEAQPPRIAKSMLGFETEAYEQGYRAGRESALKEAAKKLGELRRTGEQKDDSELVNKAQTILTWIEENYGAL
jgi:hypothetical protein